MFISTLRRLARVTSMAAIVVASSGVLETTGLPLCACVGDATLKLAVVQFETEKLRRKLKGALIVVANSRAGTGRTENPVKPVTDVRSGAESEPPR
jgi:hypothetical protein